MEEVKRKKRIGICTSYIGQKTGFSTANRALLMYWSKKYSDRYEFFHLAMGAPNSPDFQRWPFHVETVFQNVDQNQYSKSPDYQRFVAYGNTAIRDFVVKHKLDGILWSEDVWAGNPDSYYKTNWYKKVKDNFIFWSTADSIPILPSFKEWADNCPNTFYWADFAAEELKKEDPERFAHCGTIHAPVDTKNEWKPISKIEKNELRTKFGIPLDSVIFGVTNRNQLRKLYPNILSSYAIFRQRNPQYKTGLYLHTSWQEGWDLKRLIEENGIDNKEVFTTYYCQACPNWEVKNFEGENLPCKCCNQKNTMITAGVASHISNKDLAKIYGMWDASFSLFTSGGAELHSIQSCLMELPLLCTNYTCGKEFCEQPFIESCDGSMYYEIGTLFQKFTANPNTIVKFIKKICDMSPEKRKEMGQKAREWAIKTFDVEIIGEQIKSLFDKFEYIDWSDYHGEGGKLEQYNPNAVIDPNLEGAALVDTLYKSCLGMELPNEDPGKLGWCTQLSQGVPKDQIISFFRNTAEQERQKLLGPKSISDLFTPEDREKTILVGIPKSYGDCIWLSGLLKGLQENYPDKDIAITCEPQYFSVFEGNPYVKKMIPWNSAYDNIFLLEGSGERQNLVFMYFPIHFSSQRMIDYVHYNKQINGLEMEDR